MTRLVPFLLLGLLAGACGSKAATPTPAPDSGAAGATPQGNAGTGGQTDAGDAPAPAADVLTTPEQAPAVDAPADHADAPASTGSDAADTGSGNGAAGSDGGVELPRLDDAGTPQPSPRPKGYPAGSAPRIEQKSLMGTNSKSTIGFNVYLPPGYDSGNDRYPVVYDLHGLTGSQFEDSQWVIPSLEAAMKKNLIGPVIVVFPDGLMESYYADGKGGVKPSETRIIRDLIPHIDVAYRTVPNRQLRAVTGFSMGGYGAMELVTKFPDLFRVGVAYDAALDTWTTLVGRRAYIATAQFGDDQAYFDLYSPWAWATKYAPLLRTRVALRLVPGSMYQMFDAAFRDHLAGLQIPLDYVETNCPHDYGCALMNQGAQSWTFIESAFEKY
jgi:S-formylglutathione hydrolase FrmB